MTRWQLTCSALALFLGACGSSDNDDLQSGTGGARAGSAGRSQGGSAGTPRGGASGASKGGASGSAQGGASGSPKGGSSGSAQGGSSGGTAQGGASKGGSSGTPQGGSSGALQGGSSGTPQGGSSGSPQGGLAGFPQGGLGGASEGGASYGGEGGFSDAGAAGGPSSIPFSCSDLPPVAADASARSCYDFSQPESASHFTSDGGTWSVSGGAYVATGPAAAVTCTTGGSEMTASVVNGLSAANVRVRARITSIDRADKVIVLRSRDPGNRIELNFRAIYDDSGPAGGDVVVQELVDCGQVNHGGPVSLPHEMGQALDVVIELRGQALTLTVDGTSVISRNYTFSSAAGSVGFGVILEGISQFDNFVVEQLN